MEKKQSFYKNQHEKRLAGVVDEFYNDIIGGNENGYLDNREYHCYTMKELCDEIINLILKSKESLFGLEPKHIRFMGKERISEIVIHRCEFRHRVENKWLWEM